MREGPLVDDQGAVGDVAVLQIEGGGRALVLQSKLVRVDRAAELRSLELEVFRRRAPVDASATYGRDAAPRHAVAVSMVSTPSSPFCGVSTTM